MDPAYVADTIKDLCKSKNCTVQQLLQKCGINRNFLYDLRCGKIPAVDKLELIADSLNCSVDYLLGRTDRIEVNR